MIENLKSHRSKQRAALKIQAFLLDCLKSSVKIKNTESNQFLTKLIRRFSNDSYNSDDDQSYKERKMSLAKKLTKRSQELASESYQTMLKNYEEGEVCIMEQCYIIFGSEPNRHSLIFSALQSLVDSEREVSNDFWNLTLRNW